MYEVELSRDAQHYSDLCAEQERADEAEAAAEAPVAHIVAAIRAAKPLTDAQLRRLIVTLACKAAENRPDSMIVAMLDDAGDSV